VWACKKFPSALLRYTCNITTRVQVDVEAEVDGWLHCVNRYGIRGLVPASYIRILGANDGPSDVASQLFGGYGASSVTPPPFLTFVLLNRRRRRNYIIPATSG